MQQDDLDSLALWANSAGLDIPRADLGRAHAVIEGYTARLTALRSLGLEREHLLAEQLFLEWGNPEEAQA